MMKKKNVITSSTNSLPIKRLPCLQTKSLTIDLLNLMEISDSHFPISMNRRCQFRELDTYRIHSLNRMLIYMYSDKKKKCIPND